MSNKKTKLVDVDALLRDVNKTNREFKVDLEKEELLEGSDSLDSIKNEIKGYENTIEVKKNGFINEIKGGLGDMIKKNPGGVKVIKKSFITKTKDIINKIFTKF
jgi:hypothetical protein